MAHKSTYREQRKKNRSKAAVTLLPINKLSLSKEQLLLLPSDDRKLLFLSGYALNEMCVFSKLSIAAAQTAQQHEGPQASVELCQATIVVRSWSIKIFEAWMMFTRFFQSNSQISSSYLPLLGATVLDAKRRLNAYFGKSGSVAAFRNKASHMPDADQLERAFDSLSQVDVWEIFGGQTRGNMFAATTEVLVWMAFSHELQSRANPTNVVDFIAELHRISDDVATLLEGCQTAILRKHFPDRRYSQAFSVSEPANVDELRLPFFVDETSLAPYEK